MLCITILAVVLESILGLQYDRLLSKSNFLEDANHKPQNRFQFVFFRGVGSVA